MELTPFLPKIMVEFDIAIIGSCVVFLGKVINLCFIILLPSGNASNIGIFSIASPEYCEPFGWFSLYNE